MKIFATLGQFFSACLIELSSISASSCCLNFSNKTHRFKVYVIIHEAVGDFKYCGDTDSSLIVS